MMSLSDLAILNMIKDPSTRERGYRALMETYQKRVYGIIRKMVIVHEDADDITQNTFIKAIKNLDSFQNNASLFTWLYRIATNESLNFLEKKKRRYFFPVEDHEEVMKSYIDDSPLIDGDEIQRRLQKSLLSLPEKQRLVFNLKYFDDLSYDEISKITDTSVGALKASYHHAVKKIENELKVD
ncbi:RNA polymerase sigma-70 factor, ECF subfamily [Belliella buryatensis]|jgi:RNA polymerase sigma factor (sigma-70 family)|uniref:RNA polymerase sigma factor n=1 Tax=Belliella buryatensis TaxID=1500549 RepID=A0A239D4J6_9BACT|nr:RNA polymerase sigma factor [Belliella buryatensis]SNS26533.1 RNA polymerase sigma-70 factor, ECF subfamily [Belliella buryatensis]